MRGGGGGSFGVVVSVTVNAYPDYPVLFARVNYTAATPDAQFWQGVEAAHTHLATINDHGGSGYYKITPAAPISATETASVFNLMLVFVNQTDPQTVSPLANPLVSSIHNATGLAPALAVIPFPSMSSMYATLFTGNDTTGVLGQVGSRLISRAFFDSASSSDPPSASPASRITSALSELHLGPSEYIQGCLVGGGQVARNRDVDSALNPAWRETMLHVMFTRFWSPDTPFAEQEAIAENITHEQLPRLKALEARDMGAYLNEADANEPEFRDAFWGGTYERLYEVKAARDPGGLFIVRLGVGSEDWDEDGLCRV